MDYNNVYTSVFKNKAYSKEHHTQYDMVINRLSVIYNKNSVFHLIDIGSGRGHLIKMIKQNFPNCIITSVDLSKFHSEIIYEFITCDLSVESDRKKLLEKKYDVVTCTDVLEHLNENFIEDVIKTLSSLANHSMLAIANHSDIWNGVELHTIQRNFEWWNELITKYYRVEKSEIKYNNRLYEFDCYTK